MSNLKKKKKFSTSIFAHASSCGRCGKPKLSDIVQPGAKPSISHHQKSRFSSSSSGDRDSGLSLDEDCSSTSKSTRIHSPAVIGIGDSIAIEKDSDDPYEDFRHSMLQMIIEKRIYSSNGLRELLNCFLDLNSPHHHETIVKAFTEIWNEFKSDRHWISNIDRKPPSAEEG